MGTIRFYQTNTKKEEMINIFNNYKIKNQNDISLTLARLTADGYNHDYFKTGFFTYLEFIEFFGIDLSDFEYNGWVKWSYPDVKKSNIFKEEDIEKMRNYFKPLDRR